MHPLRQLIATPDLPELGPRPRPNRAAKAEIDRLLSTFFTGARPAPAVEALIRSAVLLWHDYLEESHEISQGIATADGSFLHGIMHRREPDYSNAKYWFRQTGMHPCFSILAERVEPLLTREAPEWTEILIPKGKWDAFAFVDLCAKADAKEVSLLKEVQRFEFEAFLDSIEGRLPRS